MRSIAFGILFGFVLSRVGATDYDAISGMFRLTDLHLMGVIGVAVLISALGFAIVRSQKMVTVDGTPIVLAKKPMTERLVAGSLIFGAGWALTGTCPGTALAQIGEGKLFGIVTFAGILIGAFLGQAKRVHGLSETPHATEIGGSTSNQLLNQRATR